MTNNSRAMYQRRPLDRADTIVREKPTGLEPGAFQQPAVDLVHDLAGGRRCAVAQSCPAAHAGPTAAASAARLGTAARRLGSGCENAVGADRVLKPTRDEICKNVPFSASHSNETRNTL